MTHNSSGSSAILPIAEHYRVTYRGRKLIEDTKEPLFNACHALVAIGCKGRLEMSGGASYARAIARDIEQKVNNPPDSLSYTVTEAHLTERGRRRMLR